MGDRSQETSSHTQPTRPSGRTEVIQATVRAAADLFADRSPSQVPVREIAAKAGVSHALVHRYLGSKENIFRHALAYNREAMAHAHPTCHEGRSVLPFDCNAAQSRYIRTIVRASLDGFTFSADEFQPPRPSSRTDLAITHAQAHRASQSPEPPCFDTKVVFSAVAAMAVGMAIAEEFCLVQSGLEDANRGEVCAEMDRITQHILSLACAAGDGAVEPDAETCCT